VARCRASEGPTEELTAGEDQLPQESANVTSGSGHSSPGTAVPSPFGPSVFTCPSMSQIFHCHNSQRDGSEFVSHFPP
jgi:hypothetical protein